MVPADAVAEWWRGRSDIREHILGFVVVEPLTEVAGATTIDAIVMASAAQRGEVVYTARSFGSRTPSERVPGSEGAFDGVGALSESVRRAAV
jgi:hypothetical protein